MTADVVSGRPPGAARSFRSTPPHEGRRDVPVAPILFISFDPRPRTGGDYDTRKERCRPCCFDPRPRTGGDRPQRRSAAHMPVSIHAPARGATAGARGKARPRASFDPRPRTGGDWQVSPHALTPKGFDPRPRTGGDRRWPPDDRRARVSIHAPARGATAWRGWRRSTPARFRSTPPHGGRLC